MAEADQAVEWYLARDGQQHGPITATEMSKIVELGYLLPTDLVWRQGFDEWRPAHSVFPPAPRPAAPAQPPRPTPAQNEAPPQQRPAAAGSPQQPQHTAAPQPQRPAAQPAQPAAQPRPAAQPAPAAAQPRPAAQPHAPHGAPMGQQPVHAPAAQRPAGGPGPQSPTGIGAHPIHIPGTPGPHDRLVPGEDQLTTDEDAWEDDEPRRRFPWVAIVGLLFLCVAAAGGYAVYSGHLPKIFGGSRVKGHIPIKTALPDKTAPRGEVAPVTTAVAATDTAVDAQLQTTPVWKLVKTEFPDWYQERVRETVRMKSEGKTDKAVAAQLAEALVGLRRKHVNEALAASPGRLKAIASSFLDNLTRLSKHSVEACYGFISQGETNPLIVELTRASEFTGPLNAQELAIFSAIADGRRTPVQHKSASREDYDLLAAQLSKRGWTPSDLQLFSDARELSRASPDRVCKMVQDWFAAQLAVADEAVQIRLLVEALKPVVAG